MFRGGSTNNKMSGIMSGIKDTPRRQYAEAGNVKSFDEETSFATLYNDDISTNMILITLDKSYNLTTKKVTATSNKIEIPIDSLGFCLVSNGNYIGSYFTQESLDIETVCNSVEILKFLRVAYYPLAEYFNDTGYEKNRMVREKARFDKKIAKRANKK